MKNYILIPLRNKNGEIIAKSKIDKCKSEIIKKYSWCYDCGYVKGRVNKKNILLHRFLMGDPKGKVIDHINGNGLDNRLLNLRIANCSINALNTKKTKGILANRGWGNKKYEARITINGKSKFLGYFSSKKEAMKRYQEYKKSILCQITKKI